MNKKAYELYRVGPPSARKEGRALNLLQKIYLPTNSVDNSVYKPPNPEKNARQQPLCTQRLFFKQTKIVVYIQQLKFIADSLDKPANQKLSDCKNVD